MAQLSVNDQAELDKLNGVTNTPVNKAGSRLSVNDQKELDLLNAATPVVETTEEIGFFGGSKEALKANLTSVIRGITPDFVEEALTNVDISQEEELLQSLAMDGETSVLPDLFDLKEERRQRAAEEFLGLKPSNKQFSKGGNIGYGLTDVLLDPETWAAGPAGMSTKAALSTAGRASVMNTIQKGTRQAPANRLTPPNIPKPATAPYSRAGSLAVLGTEATLGSLGGVVGGEVAGDVARSYELGPTATTATVLTGGMLGGGSASAGTGTVIRSVKVGAKTLGTAYRTTPEAGETYIATSQVKNLLDTALENDPQMLGNVAEFMESVKGIPELSEFIDPWVAMVDNPIMKSEFVNVLRKPEFRAYFEPRLKKTKQILKEYKVSTYGDPSVTKQGVYKFAEKRAEIGKRKLSEIEAKIDKVSGFLSQNRNVSDFKIGEIILSGVEKKKKQIKAILSPRYLQLKADAAAENIVFNPSNTGALYTFAKEQINEDVFKRFPRVFNDVIGKWKSKPVLDPKGNPVLNAEGNVVREYPEVDYSQIDSLKRAINKSIGQTKDSRDLMELFNLKKAFDVQLDTLNPKFVDDYRSTDYDYYTMLGMPFNKATMTKISSARFSRDSVPTLTTEQGAKEFLGAMGSDGVPVLKQAILAKMSDKAVNKDGSFNMESLQKEISDRNLAPVIELAGLTGSLKDKSDAFDLINASLVNHKRNYRSSSEEYTESFFGAAYETSLETVVGNILEGNRVGSKMLDEIDGFGTEAKEIATTALQSHMVDRALDSGLPVNEFIQNNVQAFDRVFGKDYAEKISSIGTIMDKIGEVNVHDLMIGNQSAAKGPIEKAVNIKGSSLVSVARDRISSLSHKIIIIGSRLNAGRVDKKSKQTMADFMKNKEVIEAFDKMAQLTKQGIPWRKALEQTSGVFFRSVVMGSNVGGRVATETQQERNR